MVSPATTSNPFSVETFGILGFGYGENSRKYEDEWSYGKLTHAITQIHAAAGVNLRLRAAYWLSFVLGTQVGCARVNWEAEDKWHDEPADPDGKSVSGKSIISDADFGLFYGAKFGAELEVAASHFLTFGVAYTGTTAQPKIGPADEGAEMEKQTYLVFSVGYRHAF